jgi:hypothetical protein
MALARCILGKFLGVVCHCFPPYMQYANNINIVVNDKCVDKCVSVLLHISHIAVADQHFGTNRFCPLFPKSVHDRDYSTDWRSGSSKHFGRGVWGEAVLC